jgi:hypothetical protein
VCYSEDMQTTTSPFEITALFNKVKQEGSAARVAQADKFFDSFNWAEQLALVGWYGTKEDAVDAMAGSLEQVKAEFKNLESDNSNVFDALVEWVKSEEFYDLHCPMAK